MSSTSARVTVLARSWKFTRIVRPLTDADRQDAAFEQALVGTERAHDRLVFVPAAGHRGAAHLARCGPGDDRLLRFLQMAHQACGHGSRQRHAGGAEAAGRKARVAEQAQLVVIDGRIAVQVLVAGVVLVAEDLAARCRGHSPGRMSGLHRISRSSPHSSVGLARERRSILQRALLDFRLLTSSDSVACRVTPGRWRLRARECRSIRSCRSTTRA